MMNDAIKRNDEDIELGISIQSYLYGYCCRSIELYLSLNIYTSLKTM